MRPLRALLPLVLLLAAFAAGCGGEQVNADEVPGAPPDIPVPEVERGGSDILAGDDAAAGDEEQGSEEDSSSTEEQDPAASGEEPQGSTGTGTGGTAAGGGTAEAESGGTAAPQTAQPGADSPENDTAPPAGSEAERFEDFCAQNAGAC